MEKFSYLITIFIFYLPVIIAILFQHGKTIKNNIFLVKWAVAFSLIVFFVFDTISVYWGAWSYNDNKVLGIKVVNSVIEELLWAVLLSFVLAVVVGDASDREENKQPFLVKR